MVKKWRPPKPAAIKPIALNDSRGQTQDLLGAQLRKSRSSQLRLSLCRVDGCYLVVIGPMGRSRLGQFCRENAVRRVRNFVDRVVPKRWSTKHKDAPEQVPPESPSSADPAQPRVGFSVEKGTGSNVPSAANDAECETRSADDLLDITQTLSGRRIVDPGVLALKLDDGCASCKSPLRLSNCVQVKRVGFASMLYIRCECGFITNVPTCASHQGSSSRSVVYDVNTKAAMGMINAGLGPSQVNTLMADMNIPPVCPKTLKRREREVGPAIESLAKRSCKRALEAEVKLSEGNGIRGSYDMGWQKRGAGKAYNSLSGVGHLVGSETNLVIGVETFSRSCVTCERAEARAEKPKEHDCRRNWTGSSKSMEPAGAVNIVKQIESEGHKVSKLVGDDDASTISHLRREVSPTIEKGSDKNHLKKSFTNKLYTLRSAGHKEVSKKNIKYLQMCFTYAINQNQGNADGLRASLEATIPHAYNDHSHCTGLQWCHHTTGGSEEYGSLPNKKPLSNVACREALEELFKPYIEMAPRLANAGSTQRNESFNQLVSTKHPKNKFYAGTESLDFRVGAAVLQTNEGHGFVCDVMKKVSLSPGTHTAASAARADNRKSRDSERRSSSEYKLRRRLSKEWRSTGNDTTELREGTSYSTECDMKGISPDDITQIPPPPDPTRETIVTGSPPLVVFDLETTSLERSCNITQIAATFIPSSENPHKNAKEVESVCTGCRKVLPGVILRICKSCHERYHHMCQLEDEEGRLCNDCCRLSAHPEAARKQAGTTQASFSAYALPEQPIQKEASKVTGRFVSNGQLLYKGRAVESAPIADVLDQFFNWINSMT